MMQHAYQLPRSCRFSVQETVQLLAEVGLRDGSAFESNGITGGDLLELDSDELRDDLGLTNLQVSSAHSEQFMQPLQGIACVACPQA